MNDIKDSPYYLITELCKHYKSLNNGKNISLRKLVKESYNCLINKPQSHGKSSYIFLVYIGGGGVC